MVTLPKAISLGVDTPQSNRSIVSFDGSAKGKAMQQAGQELQQFGAKAQGKMDEQKTASDNLQAAQATLSYRQELDAAQQKLSENPDGYLTYDKDFAALETQARAKYAATIQDENKRALFDVSSQELAMPYQRNVRAMSKSVFADKTVAIATAASEQEKAYQLSNPDPVRLGQTQILIKNSIEPLIADGTLDQVKADSLIRTLNNPAQATYWDSRMQRDGLGTYKELKAATKPQMTSGGLPKDVGADTVKPYDFKRINDIKALVTAPSKFDSLFEEMGAKYGVDPQELKLRAAVESGLNPTAQAKATPYGQSGGLMQLEVETAKRLGVTDRNDPRQSVEGAAKLLAQHQATAGGDQTKVDKLYYAGSEKMMGKNTEQYAANLAAVRGANSESAPSLPFQLDPDIAIQKMNQARAYASIAVKEDMQQIDDAMKFTTLLPQQAISDLKAKTLDLNMPEEYKKVVEFEENQKMLTDFIPKSLSEQRVMLQDGIAKIRGGNLAEVSKVEAMKNTLDIKEKALKEDAWSYLQANNLVQMPEGSVLSGNSAEVLRARRIEANKAAPMIAGMELPLATNAEINQMIADYDAGKNMGSVLSNLGANLTAQERRVMANAISKKNTVLAAAMSLDPATSSKVLSGNKGKGFVSEDKFKLAIAEKLAGVALTPEMQDSMIETAYSYYKQRAIDTQDVNTEPNTNLIDETMSKIVGNVEPISVHGMLSKVVVPPNMTAYEVQDKLNGMKQSDLAAMGNVRDIYGDSMSPESLLRNNRVISSGNGIYNLLNQKTGEVVLNAEGKPFVIDISKITSAPASSSKLGADRMAGGF